MTTTPNTRLNGEQAIEYAEQHGLTLHKYADPIEYARSGLSPDEARRVAAQGGSLIYIDPTTPQTTDCTACHGDPQAIDPDACCDRWAWAGYHHDASCRGPRCEDCGLTPEPCLHCGAPMNSEPAHDEGMQPVAATWPTCGDCGRVDEPADGYDTIAAEVMP